MGLGSPPPRLHPSLIIKPSLNPFPSSSTLFEIFNEPGAFNDSIKYSINTACFGWFPSELCLTSLSTHQQLLSALSSPLQMPLSDFSGRSAVMTGSDVEELGWGKNVWLQIKACVVKAHPRPPPNLALFALQTVLIQPTSLPWIQSVTADLAFFFPKAQAPRPVTHGRLFLMPTYTLTKRLETGTQSNWLRVFRQFKPMWRETMWAPLRFAKSLASQTKTCEMRPCWCHGVGTSDVTLNRY